uniref:Peptidase S1 domain-containing protein n=1 Tax=Anopheles atroparvus TaxID=41427 RepID=A0AAG5DHL9_ANOAO
MAKPLVACRFLVAIIAVSNVANVACETFQFPDFVAIERNESPVCGGWIVDKTFRRYVLATERCAAEAAEVRELLVRYGSAKITWRTLSSGVDRKLYHPSHERLVVLSTFGKFRRQAPTYEPQHHNGTVMLSWGKRNGVLEKTALVLADDQERQLAQLAGALLCKSPAGAFVLEGALVLRNLKPYAMLSVHPSSDSGNCASSVEVLELGDLTSEWSVSVLRDANEKLLDRSSLSEENNPGWFEEANSPFGYIVYTIFLAYSMLYTMLYFILAVGKPPEDSVL